MAYLSNPGIIPFAWRLRGRAISPLAGRPYRGAGRSVRWAVRSARGRGSGGPCAPRAACSVKLGLALGELGEMGFFTPEKLAAKKRERRKKSEDGFCHRAHRARTQRKQETNGRRTDFTGGNGVNGDRFFIRDIGVIRGEKVRMVGRKEAQRAQESDEGARRRTDGGVVGGRA